MNPISNVPGPGPGPVLVLETDRRYHSPKITICEQGITHTHLYECIASTERIIFDVRRFHKHSRHKITHTPRETMPGVTRKAIDVKDLPLYTYLTFKSPRFFELLELLSEATNPNLENLP
jgi:hypothetical protein